LEYILDLFYPPRCPVCDGLSDGPGKTCKKCSNVFLLIKEPRCMKCGKQLGKAEAEYCLDCTKKKLSYIKGYPLWVYNLEMKKSVSAFKYHNKKEYGKYYAKEMARHFGKDLLSLGVQCMIPIPVHKKRLRKRGYNQAEILADELYKYIKIPVNTGILVRCKNTLPQKELNDTERLKNLTSAFKIKDKDVIIKGNIKRVLLVDDIYTTGSTVEACARVLMQAGVEEIYFTSICIGKGFD
jgi:ComF family protein